MPNLYDDMMMLMEAIKKHSSFDAYFSHKSTAYRPPSDEHDTDVLLRAVDKIEERIYKKEYDRHKDLQ